MEVQKDNEWSEYNNKNIRKKTNKQTKREHT